jgi:cysteine sulfinate desulfinase/cysteine desulfurase-like protein
MIDLKNITRVLQILSIILNEFAAEDYLLISSKYFSASTGSACNSSTIEQLHVLTELKKLRIDKKIRISIY